MLQDLRDALRQWRRTPVITVVALLSLALGIGANLSLFALVDALLLRALPVRDPQSLIRVVADQSPLGIPEADTAVTLAVWEHVRQHQPFAESVFGAYAGRVNLSQGGEVRYASALHVSGDAFDSLGVAPVIGRTLQVSDDQADAAPAAMIGYGLWHREFNGDPEVLGRTITLDAQAFTVVGVTPRDFFGLDVGRRVDVVLPLSALALIRGAATARASSAVSIYGRLAPGQAVAAGLAAYPPTRRASRVDPAAILRAE